MLHRALIATILLSLGPLGALAQARLYSWSDHYAMRNGQAVCVAGGKVYSATDVGAFSYDLKSGELDKLTKTNGLSDLNITAIAYIGELNLLVAGYQNGNVDLVYPSRVLNMPHIVNKGAGAKTVHHIMYHSGLIYLSTSFGVVVIDPNREEVADTYYIGEGQSKVEVKGMALHNGRFYAATAMGLRSASAASDLLAYSVNWSTEQPMGLVPMQGLASSDGRLYCVERRGPVLNDMLWMFDGRSWSSAECPCPNVRGISAAHGRVVLTAPGHAYVLSAQGELLHDVSRYRASYTEGNISPQQAVLLEPGRLAIADGQWGLAVGPTEWPEHFMPNGTASNLPFAMAANDNDLLVVGGAYDLKFVNTWTNFAVSTLHDGRWREYFEFDKNDAVVVTFGPSGGGDYYVGSWQHGAMRFVGGTVVERYTPDNTTLGYDTLWGTSTVCHVGGICFDAQGNMWVSNPASPRPISVRTPSGSWHSFAHTATLDVAEGRRMVATMHYHDGKLWLIIPRSGIFVLDPGRDVASQHDDRTALIRPMLPDGSVFNADCRTLEFDRDGRLWLGTSQGLLVCQNPAAALDGGLVFQQIKLPDVVEGLAVYLLDKETVTAVRIDGGNRKWVGTERSGVFLFSADGTKELRHFTAENSPLPSNAILSLEIHPATGEVFMGTDMGLVSYRGESTVGSAAYNSVAVYPNPVRPGYTGEVVISGLVESTTVKITDVAGNLVFETTSLGGTALWNCLNFSGERVATGVYLIMLSSPDGAQRAVAKLLVIR
ncbi:MAG: T9SS type A sorting domain-containing protein [Bacteroidales bacterium]|nr:T9SS type A sorting domain-containing protein [Bacteroidales bacterium]